MNRQNLKNKINVNVILFKNKKKELKKKRKMEKFIFGEKYVINVYNDFDTIIYTNDFVAAKETKFEEYANDVRKRYRDLDRITISHIIDDVPIYIYTYKLGIIKQPVEIKNDDFCLFDTYVYTIISDNKKRTIIGHDNIYVKNNNKFSSNLINLAQFSSEVIIRWVDTKSYDQIYQGIYRYIKEGLVLHLSGDKHPLK